MRYAYYGLATACRRLGQTEKSAESMQKFKQCKATDLRTQREVTKTFDDEGEVRRATAFVHAAAGSICANGGDLRQAEAYWLRATVVDPHDTVARSQLAQLYDRQSRLDNALSVLEELRGIEPANPAHCLNLGMAHLRRNGLSAAEKAYRLALEVAPQSAIGYATLAGFLLRTGRQLPEARVLAEKAVELEPTGQYCALLCAICQQLGDSPSALAAIDRARAARSWQSNLSTDPRQLERISRKNGGKVSLRWRLSKRDACSTVILNGDKHFPPVREARPCPSAFSCCLRRWEQVICGRHRPSRSRCENSTPPPWSRIWTC